MKFLTDQDVYASNVRLLIDLVHDFLSIPSPKCLRDQSSEVCPAGGHLAKSVGGGKEAGAHCQSAGGGKEGGHIAKALAAARRLACAKLAQVPQPVWPSPPSSATMLPNGLVSFIPTRISMTDADIRILREPTVYLLGRQTVDDATLDRFLADHGVAWQTDTEVAGEHLAEVAGRVCYMSFAKPRPGGNKAYLGHILEVGHGSVLEHAVWNFLFTGVSRIADARAGPTSGRLRLLASFSQRYVDESVAEYVEPDCIADDPELHRLWLDAVAQAIRRT